MALYPFTHRETGKVTLVEAKSKERAAQLVAERTYQIGDIAKGADAARMMSAGAEFIDDAETAPGNPDPSPQPGEGEDQG
jgi:hypothetical protein